MARKKFDPDHVQEPIGPMNNVASDDALVYADVDPTRPLDTHKERRVRAKKQKIKNSTKKAERRFNKEIINHYTELEDGESDD